MRTQKLDLTTAVEELADWVSQHEDRLKALERRREPQGAQARVVEADRFVVRDQAGRIRAEFGLGRGGVVALTLCDETAKPCISIFVGPSGWPTLLFLDQAGRYRLRLHVDEGVSPGEGSHARVRLQGSSLCPSAELSVGEAGGPALTFRNQDGDVTTIGGSRELLGSGLHSQPGDQEDSAQSTSRSAG